MNSIRSEPLVTVHIRGNLFMGSQIKNRTLFQGDNLPILQGMDSESIDLIATDPPFNKGRDFHATPDSLASGASFQDRWSWERDVHPDWVDSIKDDWPAVWAVIDSTNAVRMRKTKKNLIKQREEVGSDMGAYLCFMAVRLMEMRRILKSTGSLYLHCDSTASHYLKALLDAIFGWGNFRNEIVWNYRRWTGKAKHFQRLHDTIFYYVKSPNIKFNFLYTDYTEGSKERKLQGVLHRFKKGDRPYLVSCEQVDKKGVPENDVWRIPFVAPSAKERTGFKTQKPLALYERIIKASSNPGDIVLDPFAGCATTLIAAERLGRHWVGIDLWENACNVVQERLGREFLETKKGVKGEQKPLGYGDRVRLEREPPQRSDSKETAAPFLQVRERVQEPPGRHKSRADMYQFLLRQNGIRCQGCDRVFDDPRYLELDHNTPRADGGMNHISNRVLLCGPCNRAKSNIYTLSGLRKLNRENGWMAKGTTS